MPSSQSNQSVLDALKIGRAYQNLPAVNKCDAIPPQALHRMKVDDIAAVTLFKILCRCYVRRKHDIMTICANVSA